MCESAGKVLGTIFPSTLVEMTTLQTMGEVWSSILPRFLHLAIFIISVMLSRMYLEQHKVMWWPWSIGWWMYQSVWQPVCLLIHFATDSNLCADDWTRHGLKDSFHVSMFFFGMWTGVYDGSADHLVNTEDSFVLVPELVLTRSGLILLSSFLPSFPSSVFPFFSSFLSSFLLLPFMINV